MKKEHEDEELEGEGSRSAARRYDEKATDYADSGKVDDAARAAESAFDAGEGSGDREAAEEGKRHAKEEDPLLREDRSAPEDPNRDRWKK